MIKIAAGVLILVAVLVVIALLIAPSSKSADFRLELAKAFVQLAVVTVLGGLVAATVRYVESRREENRRLDEYWADLYREVVAAYNGVKAVRRTLRASGFGSHTADALSADQVEQFRMQMTSLLQSQLSLESVGRELRTRQAADTGDACKAINRVESYVHDIIEDWEVHGHKITQGASSTQLDDLERLRSFLGDTDQGFGTNARDPMERLAKFTRGKLGTEHGEHTV